MQQVQDYLKSPIGQHYTRAGFRCNRTKDAILDSRVTFGKYRCIREMLSSYREWTLSKQDTCGRMKRLQEDLRQLKAIEEEEKRQRQRASA